MSGFPEGLNLAPMLPELMLTGGLLLLLLFDLGLKRRQGVTAAAGGAALLAVVTVAVFLGREQVGPYLFDAVVQDGATVFFRALFIAATGVSLLMLVFSYREDGEPYLLMLAGLLGMFFLAGSNDVVTLFVALELVSITSYVLAGYRRGDARSAEAALKYVIYGAVSSGLMVYGFSLLYGLSGTTNIPEMAARLSASGAPSAALLLAVVMALAGIGYKIAMVPFHFWSPDVYEGSPTAVTAFFSVAPKAAGFAALLRLMPVFNTLDAGLGVGTLWLITLASAVTMTFGNLGAIWQDSLKRLLAYSSIAHAGYILMGFAVMAAHPEGELNTLASRAVMFYLVVYLLMNLGAFLVVDAVERRLGSDSILHFRGLGKTSPLPALALAVCLFSLVGLPPLAGFIGKFYLFAALIKGKLFGLAVIGAVNTVISLFYYVRIIRDMFLQEPEETAAGGVAEGVKFEPLAGVLAVVLVVPTVVLGVFWGPLAAWIAGRMP